MLRAVVLLSLALIAYSCGFSQLKRPPLGHLSTTSIKRNAETSVGPTYQNMRIVADYSNLGSIDAAQRDYIQNQLIPSAISYYETALKVKRNFDTLQVSGACYDYFPSDDILNNGVEADLLLVITAENLPDESYVAAAVPCDLSPDDDRPIYGTVIINLAYLPIGKVTDHQENLATALHELMHVLGFNSDIYQYFRNPKTGEPLTGILGNKNVNGFPVTYLNVEPLTSKLRTYFDCQTLEGAYLENEGGEGSLGSHFERRVFMNEYMTASSIPEPVISEFSLALLEGSGWYQVNYNMTEPFNWGRGQGCEFLDTACVTPQGIPNFFEFCDTNVVSGCTFTNRAKGFCTSQFDPFSDMCPYYQSSPNYDCKDETNQLSAALAGETYGLSSRCYTGTLAPPRFIGPNQAFCFATQCQGEEGSFQLTLMIGDQEITCTAEGPVNVAGYTGVLDCPDPNEFCVRSNPRFCEKGCSGRGTCVDGSCRCPTGWGGTDCAEIVDVSTPIYEGN